MDREEESKKSRASLAARSLGIRFRISAERLAGRRSRRRPTASSSSWTRRSAAASGFIEARTLPNCSNASGLDRSGRDDSLEASVFPRFSAAPKPEVPNWFCPVPETTAAGLAIAEEFPAGPDPPCAVLPTAADSPSVASAAGRVKNSWRSILALAASRKIIVVAMVAPAKPNSASRTRTITVGKGVEGQRLQKVGRNEDG